jgi:hypothetical protein
VSKGRIKVMGKVVPKVVAKVEVRCRCGFGPRGFYHSEEIGRWPARPAVDPSVVPAPM